MEKVDRFEQKAKIFILTTWHGISSPCDYFWLFDYDIVLSWTLQIQKRNEGNKTRTSKMSHC